jgi:hypothetical protein
MTKVIFHPGRSVSTRWLNASQYLGPSNPGVVFVANPINDWEYPLIKAESLDLSDMQSFFVTRSANQSIDGVKTFSSIPEFPKSTQVNGSQAVNVDRLNTDLGVLATTSAAALAALSTNLNTNFVTLATNQSLTGTKNFASLTVPVTPAGPTAPIAKQYYDDNTVQLTGAQTINGTKTFTDIQVPSPNSSGDAVNLGYLLGALATAPVVTQNCIRFGNVQIVYGTLTVTNNWGAGGVVSLANNLYTAISPSMANFSYISAFNVCSDRLLVYKVTATLTEITIEADEANPSIPQPSGGNISYWVIGYTS